LFKVSKEEYKKFAGFSFPKYSCYSNNDNYFGQLNLESYANDIGAKHIFLKDKGHFSITDGVYEFPEVIDIIKGLRIERRH
jgi:predicted alpha/beta hydrolase family esterase